MRKLIWAGLLLLSGCVSYSHEYTREVDVVGGVQPPCDAAHVGANDSAGSICHKVNTAEFGELYLWEWEGK